MGDFWFDRNGICIYGESPERKNISGLRFVDVSLRLENRTDWPKKNVDLRPCGFDGLVESGLNAVYCRNAQDLLFHHLTVELAEELKGQLEQEWNVADTEDWKHE